MQVESYKSLWKTEFDDLKIVLLNALAGYEIDIQHIGSTAIPELFAKPILDIDIIIINKNYLSQIAAHLKKIGYKSKGDQGVPGRFAYRQSSHFTPLTNNDKRWQEHHLYICFSDSLALKNHLLFRNALLNDKVLVAAYSNLKINLTKEEGMTRENYARKKTDFIIAVLKSIGLDQNELEEIKKSNL